MLLGLYSTPAKAGAQLERSKYGTLFAVIDVTQLGPGLRRGGCGLAPSVRLVNGIRLFSREGGSPGWAPAFAGEQSFE
jgi:hypothetical protein